MKMNNKKGFTLIELLAVIVILGVIALIATPIVINVIEKAKQESYKRSVEFAIDATEYYLLEHKLDEIPESGINAKDVKVANNKFTSGKIKLNSDGEKVAEKISNGTYCASGLKGELVVVKGNCEGTDITAPEIINIEVNEVTTDSITIVVEAKDDIGITGYYYAKDKEEYGANQEKNTYTYTGLEKNTSYLLKVKVEDDQGNTKEDSIWVRTSMENKPIYVQNIIKPTTSNVVVTIKYPVNKEAKWVYEYQKYTDEMGEEWTKVEGTSVNVTFTENGKLIARIKDTENEENTITASVHEVANIDREAPTLTIPADETIDDTVEEYDLMQGVSCKDNSGECSITYKGNITFRTHGEYKIEYTAVDLAGNKDTKTRTITVSEPQYVEADLQGNVPKLGKRLVPITIESDGAVKVADTTKEWYNYSKQKWANAVLLNKDIEYEANSRISKENIKGYFVWIPRYRYQIFNEGSYTSTEKNPTGSKALKIEIKFQNINEVSSGSTLDTWLTHPAFTTMKVSGFWVGKFEPTGTIEEMTVLPNEASSISGNAESLFKNIYNFSRDLNSHMMKNTEWGAVAYLSHSQYGKYGNIDYTDSYKEIFGNTTTTTGRSEGLPGINKGDKTYIWTDIENRGNGKGAGGAGASTTGNITGIYDMSGGKWEVVAGYTKNGNSNNIGFVADYDSKYFDVYNNDNSSNPTRNYGARILGDATGEMGPFYPNGALLVSSWYSDTASFIYSGSPWFMRGYEYTKGSSSNYYVTYAGIFAFDIYSSTDSRDITSRVVLAP